MATKNKYLLERVETRLAQLEITPCPPLLKAALMTVLETKVDKLVVETLKDWPTVMEYGKKVVIGEAAAQGK